MLPSLLTRDTHDGLKQSLLTGFEPADLIVEGGADPGHPGR